MKKLKEFLILPLLLLSPFFFFTTPTYAMTVRIIPSPADNLRSFLIFFFSLIIFILIIVFIVNIFMLTGKKDKKTKNVQIREKVKKYLIMLIFVVFLLLLVIKSLLPTLQFFLGESHPFLERKTEVSSCYGPTCPK